MPCFMVILKYYFCIFVRSEHHHLSGEQQDWSPGGK